MILTVYDKPVEVSGAIQMTLVNFALSPDQLARALSYTFTITASPYNMALLGHLNRLDLRQKRREIPARILDDTGAILHEGFLVLLKRNEDNISVMFRDAGARLAENLAKVKTTNLTDTITVPQTQLPGYQLVLLATQPLYELEIDGVTFSNTSGDRLAAAFDLRSQINTHFGKELVTFDESTYTLAVWPVPLSGDNWNGIGWVNEASFTGFTYTAGDYWAKVKASEKNFFDWMEAQYATPRTDIAWPMVYHQSFFDDQEEYLQFVNHGKDGVATGRAWVETVHPAFPYIPFFRYKWLLQRVIESAGGVAMQGDLVDDAEFEQLLLWNPRDMVYFSVNEVGDYQSGWGRLYREVIKAAEHLPELTGDQVLFSLTKLFNLGVQVLDGTVRFTQLLPLLSKPPADWSAWVESVYEITDADDKGYSLSWKVDKGEQYASGQYGGVTVGDGGNGIELDGQILAEDNFLDRNEYPDSCSLRTCAVQRVGSSTAHLPKEIQDIPFRLFFERGLVEDDLNQDYWASANSATDYNGATVGDIDLKLYGEAGIAEKYHGIWPALEDKPLVAITALIPIGELHRVKTWENPMIRYYHRMGSVKAIIKEIQYDDDQANGFVRVQVSAIML